jgi:putative transposase
MWTPTARQQHSRSITRYQTDLTDAEWRVIAPHLPKPYATGRPREWPMREIINGIFYVMRAGCPCRLRRTTCRHGEQFTAGSPSGATTGALDG